MPILGATLAVVLCPAAPAKAVPIDLRVEGQSRTIFEGAIDTSGHNVQSTSEPGVLRKCDATNGGGTVAGPTPTAAAYDALALRDEGFSGKWYPDYDDYLIEGFAGERNANWGLLRNEAATTRGGCQVRLDGGDRVVWAAGGARTPIVLTALTSTSASPVTVRATTPAGVAVAGAAIYSASAAGVPGQTLATTASDGAASVAYGGGFQRLKATASNMTRSNRVVACVSACADAPPDLAPRTAPPNGPLLGNTTTPLRLTRPKTGSSGYRRGLIAVRWRIEQRGVGLLRWGIASDDLSSKGKRYVGRARGTTQTSALVKLPAGRTHALRFTSVDRMLNRKTVDIGRVIVPIDDRSKAVRRAGPWSRGKATTAWKGTILRGRPGARVRVKLAGGKPTLLLRGRRGSAILRVEAGRSTETIRVREARLGVHQFVKASRRSRSGIVTVRVLRGAIDLDGVAASP